jgi:hypothetical protein
VRSAAALALLAFVLAGCAKERPSAFSIAACLRDHRATIRTVTFRHSPAGLRDDWTGVVFLNYSTFDSDDPAALLRSRLGEGGLLVVARSDPDARRLAQELKEQTQGALSVPIRGSVLYTPTPLARRCL